MFYKYVSVSNSIIYEHVWLIKSRNNELHFSSLPLSFYSFFGLPLGIPLWPINLVIESPSIDTSPNKVASHVIHAPSQRRPHNHKAHISDVALEDQIIQRRRFRVLSSLDGLHHRTRSSNHTIHSFSFQLFPLISAVVRVRFRLCCQYPW